MSNKFKFRLVESIEELDEQRFLDLDKLYIHWDDHTSHRNEYVFDRGDPKFPNMSRKQYADEQEKLSLEDAKSPTDSSADVIGFQQVDPHHHFGKVNYVKIRKKSKFAPQPYRDSGYSDMVIWKPENDEITTFYIQRPNSIKRELSKMVGELPENQPKETQPKETEDQKGNKDESMNNKFKFRLVEAFDSYGNVVVDKKTIDKANRIVYEYSGYRRPEEIREMWERLDAELNITALIQGYPDSVQEDGGKSWTVDFEINGERVSNAELVYQVYEGTGDKNDYNIYFAYSPYRGKRYTESYDISIDNGVKVSTEKYESKEKADERYDELMELKKKPSMSGLKVSKEY